MLKIDVNIVTNSYEVSHLKSNVSGFDTLSTDYGREVIVFLCEKDRKCGEFCSVQHVRHMPIVGDFAGRKDGHNYYITSIHDIKGIADVICKPKITWKKVISFAMKSVLLSLLVVVLRKIFKKK
jgi:hypothetical protein